MMSKVAVEKFFHRLSIRNTFILMLALVLSVLIMVILDLWLFESSVKYFSIIFSLALVFLLSYCLVCDHTDVYIRVRLPFASPHNLIDYLFLSLSILLLLLQHMKAILYQITPLTLPIGIILCSFLPGYWLLRVTNFRQLSSWMEWLSLSFVLSIPLISLSYTLILKVVSVEWRPFALAVLFSIFSILLLVMQRIKKVKTSHTGKLYLPKLVLLLIVVAFFVYVIESLYLGPYLVPDLDINRHFATSMRLNLDTRMYRGTELWFHIPSSAIQVLSTLPIDIFQVFTAFLALILIASFYVMANAYLHDLDKRLSIFATVFYVFFSGFGWIYFLNSKLMLQDISYHFSLLSGSGAITLHDTGTGPGILWFWYRPWTIGFITFFLLIYLLKRDSLSKRTFFLLSAMMTITLVMTHLPEFVLFVIFLGCLAAFIPNIRLRMQDMIQSNLFAIPFSILISSLYNVILGAEMVLSFWMMIALGGILVFSYILLLFKRRPKYNIDKYIKNLVPIMTAVYLGLLLYWVVNIDKIPIHLFYGSGVIPWIYYPVLLGISGLLSIMSISIIMKRFKNHFIVIFPLMAIAAIAFGRLLSFINVNFMALEYLESRILPMVSIACSILASITILETVKKFRRLKKKVVVLFLTLLVLGGISSTFLALEYSDFYYTRISLTDEEKSSINYLNKLDPWSSTLSITSRSRAITEFAPNLWQIRDIYARPLWQAKGPEYPTSILFSINGSSSIYVHENDQLLMSKDYSDGYIAQHILPLAPIGYNSSKIKIFQLPRMSPPTFASDVVLVLPLEENNNDFLYAIDILSQSYFNYTIADIFDLNTISKARVIIVPTEDLALKTIGDKKRFNLAFEDLIVMNLEGYGNLTEQVPHSYVNASYVEGLGGKVLFPFNINVSSIQNTESALAYYEPGHEPFFILNKRDGFNIYYLNIHPLIQGIKSTSNKTRELFALLGTIIRASMLNLPQYNFQRVINPYSIINNLIAFKEVSLVGQVIVNSSSMIFSNFGDAESIITVDGLTSEVRDIQRLVLLGAEEIKIISENLTTRDRHGYYVGLSFKQPDINVTGNDLTAFVFKNDGNIEVFRGKAIQFLTNSLYALVRQPTITVNGNVAFNSFYGYGELANTLQTLGQDLQIIGKVSFTWQYCDVFFIGKDFKFDGIFSRLPPVYAYDEVMSLINSSPYILLILGFLAFTFFYFRRKN
ncbi:MAG: hypothetical protein ACFFC6_13790 [Promethearchaeota archaeon]